MPLQNRVDPRSQLHAVSHRGTLMGNRGILHDDRQQITRNHGHQAWVTCLLDFRSRHRDPMPKREYTALFFLDEVTAFAAGHRPCGQCQHARYTDFVTAWQSVHGPKPDDEALPKWIDRRLHAARIQRGHQVTYQAKTADLPDGTMILTADGPALWWQQKAYPWAFTGYTDPVPTAPIVTVLTPAPVVAVFRSGFVPRTAL